MGCRALSLLLFVTLTQCREAALLPLGLRSSPPVKSAVAAEEPPFGSSALRCSAISTRDLSVQHMLLIIGGIQLFSNAGQLTMNWSVPCKRLLAALFAISGTSFLAIVCWLYGRWLPDAQTLIFSRPCAIYMGVTAVLGWAVTVTHWLDDVHNLKLNNTIRVTLQVAGLLMVYLGISDSSDERVAVTAVLVLACNRVLWVIARWLGWLLWRLTKAIDTVLQLAYKTVSCLLSSLLRGSWQLLCTSTKLVRGASSGRLVRNACTRSNAPAMAATGTSAAAAGREGTSRAKRAGRSRSWRQQQEAAAAADRLLSSDEEPELLPMLYEPGKNEPSWSPLKYKYSPPLSPLVLEQQASHALERFQSNCQIGSWGFTG